MTPTVEILGYVFVEDYYTMLAEDPDALCKFYTQDSLLSCTKATVDIVKATNKFEWQTIHISTQHSFSMGEGVIVVVTGIIEGCDNVERPFMQSFFLITQEKLGHYSVLSDTFKFVTNDATNSYIAPKVAAAKNDEVDHVTKICASEKNVTSEKSVNLERTNVDATYVDEAASSSDSSPKKSFASVVNDLRANKAPFKPSLPKPVASVVQVASTKSNNTVTSVEKKVSKSVSAVNLKPHAIFVANLPMSATVEELDNLFMQFGPIKPNGIQVISNKTKGTCFGFVDFESASSKQNAIKASPINFASRRLFIRERLENNDKGSIASKKGGNRKDNYVS